MSKKNRKVEYKSFELEVKELSDDGGLEGYLARFGNIDDYGDIIEKGAFSKTLEETKVFPLLWHHDPAEPRKIIGSFSGKQDAKGLLIKADFLPDADSQAVRQKSAVLLDRGVKLGLSIGFKAIKVAFDRIKDQSVRLLQEVQLGEGSLTLFPANELALVIQVKSNDNDDNDDPALTAEPDASTPAGEPQDDTDKPETPCLHLLDEALATVKAISNLMEAI